MLGLVVFVSKIVMDGSGGQTSGRTQELLTTDSHSLGQDLPK